MHIVEVLTFQNAYVTQKEDLHYLLHLSRNPSLMGILNVATTSSRTGCTHFRTEGFSSAPPTSVRKYRPFSSIPARAKARTFYVQCQYICVYMYACVHTHECICVHARVQVAKPEACPASFTGPDDAAGPSDFSVLMYTNFRST